MDEQLEHPERECVSCGERRPKERQVQCQACMRWKYGDERCNLFTTARLHPTVSEQS